MTPAQEKQRAAEIAELINNIAIGLDMAAKARVPLITYFLDMAITHLKSPEGKQ